MLCLFRSATLRYIKRLPCPCSAPLVFHWPICAVPHCARLCGASAARLAPDPLFRALSPIYYIACLCLFGSAIASPLTADKRALHTRHADTAKSRLARCLASAFAEERHRNSQQPKYTAASLNCARCRPRQ